MLLISGRAPGKVVCPKSSGTYYIDPFEIAEWSGKGMTSTILDLFPLMSSERGPMLDTWEVLALGVVVSQLSEELEQVEP